MSWLSKLFKGDSGGSDGGIQVEGHIYDPMQGLKNNVATPLSKFLEGSVGTGVGQYPTDPNYTNRYNEFLSMNPQDYFKTNISDPAYQQFNKYAMPLIDEGYAGSLRGSGHYGAQESGLVGLGEQLGNTAATFIPQFSQAQIQVGQSEFDRQYKNWYQGLAENNPVLAQAINFLNSGKQAQDYYQYAPSSPGLLENLTNIGYQNLGSILSKSGQTTTSRGFDQEGQPFQTQNKTKNFYEDPSFWANLAMVVAAA